MGRAPTNLITIDVHIDSELGCGVPRWVVGDLRADGTTRCCGRAKTALDGVRKRVY